MLKLQTQRVNLSFVTMHVISQRSIWSAIKKFPDCANALDGWYRNIKKNNFKNFSELKKLYSSVDKIQGYMVFNIGDNKLRLIASIHFNRQKIYIHHILDHKEYDKNKWKN